MEAPCKPSPSSTRAPKRTLGLEGAAAPALFAACSAHVKEAGWREMGHMHLSRCHRDVGRGVMG
jgi:hypothetical protein